MRSDTIESTAHGVVAHPPRTHGAVLAVLLGLGILGLGCASTQDPVRGGPTQSTDSTKPGVPTGSGGAPANSVPGVTPAPLPSVMLGATIIPRLSRVEYAASVQSLLGVDITAEAVLALPLDARVPFDNVADTQSPSSALIQGLGVVADAAADRLLANPTQLSALLPCTPTGAADEACFRQFVEAFGRRALHRPLSAAEVTDFMSFLPFATQANDFNVAAGMVIRALLQDLEFAYRVEVGTPTGNNPAVVALTDPELGARLSYLLWGQTPDDALLANVAAGALATNAGVRAEAERLLSDPRGVSHIQRFHALWLGYEELPHAPALSLALRTETDALIKRVVFDNQSSWLDVFSSPDTFIDQQLSELYGMAAPSAPGFSWVTYSDSLRRGLLSQGSLLSNGTKNGDTSPTLRGKFILERLMCSPVPPPPPGVNADTPPPAIAGTNCKVDRYAAHRTGDCAGCHSLMDPVGFGLENFDNQGRFRGHDLGKPECLVSGAGQLEATTAFRGPAELGQLLLASDKVVPCLAQHVYQFALQKQIASSDSPAINAFKNNLVASNLSLRAALLEWLGSGAFRFRTIQPFSM